MTYHLLSRTIRNIVGNKLYSVPVNCSPIRHTSSGVVESSNKRKFPYVKYLVITLGGTITFSFIYHAYRWIVQIPICPNFDRNQYIHINYVLTCTALLRNVDKQCSGNSPMKKIGAATGVNFKLVQTKSEGTNLSTRINLNDNNIIQRNIFDETYVQDYFETLADLLIKLDEIHRINLLRNIVGYYVYVCSECHSTTTRQMISCTSYLNEAELQRHAVDVSEIEWPKK